jgi:hypothetical protein
LPEIHLYYKAYELIWRGQPVALFAARRHYRESLAILSPNADGVVIVRNILLRGISEDGPEDPAVLDILLAWALENSEDPVGEAPGWLRRYVGECDLDIWFRLVGDGVELVIAQRGQ